jgi:hypothetical protein
MHFQVIFGRESASAPSLGDALAHRKPCLTMPESVSAIHQSKTKGVVCLIEVTLH